MLRGFMAAVATLMSLSVTCVAQEGKGVPITLPFEADKSLKPPASTKLLNLTGGLNRLFKGESADANVITVEGFSPDACSEKPTLNRTDIKMPNTVTLVANYVDTSKPGTECAQEIVWYAASIAVNMGEIGPGVNKIRVLGAGNSIVFKVIKPAN